jgi:hypothetical protein
LLLLYLVFFFCIINFAVTIFLFLFLLPSVSLLFLCYNPLFSLPTSLSAPSHPLSPLVFVRKNAAHKESSREKSHIHRAKFNGRPKLPGWPGKHGAAANMGEEWLL